MWPHVRTFDSSPISSEILFVSFDSGSLVFSFSVSLFCHFEANKQTFTFHIIIFFFISQFFFCKAKLLLFFYELLLLLLLLLLLVLLLLLDYELYVSML